ncbi:hypothetical protein AB0I02_13180 [Streptomyces phaeochromogenes]
MRHSALLIGAEIQIGQGPHGGTEIRLNVTGHAAVDRTEETAR